MINICITFDYELFFDKNYCSDKEVLFDTTDRILKMLEKHGIRATFFVDNCSVMKHVEINKMDYVNAFQAQMLRMDSLNHDVQMHIHPHWLTSEYVDGAWKFDVNSYNINYYGYDRNKKEGYNVHRIIKEAKFFLENILQTQNSQYRCIAYRAGGFAIHPEQQLFQVLQENGILIDSSVAPGFKAENGVNDPDFLGAPTNLLNWWMDPQLGYKTPVKKDIYRHIFEVPVTTLKKDIYTWLTTNKDNRTYNAGKAKGTVMTNPNFREYKPKTNFMWRLNNFLNTPYFLSLDACSSLLLTKAVKQMYQKYNCAQNDYYVSMLCHPKLTYQAGLDNMEQFLLEMKKMNSKIRFITLRDVYDEITK